ncbi:hypothetical protein GG851_18465 [Bordetella petrii]|nr:hypothetical protein [Bordetella petrii]
MTVDIIVPKLGLTMEEGTVIEWHRADGESVARGQPLFTLETDKVAYEVAAEADGWLERVVGIDVTLPIGAVVGRLHEQPPSARGHGGAASSGTAASPVEPLIPASPTLPPSAPASSSPASLHSPESAAHPAVLFVPSDRADVRKLVSPVARRIAAERGIDVSTLDGSGPGGVVLRRDVEQAEAQSAGAETPKASADTVAQRGVAAAPPRRRPLAGMRRVISQRMTASLAGSAQMSAFTRVDMGEAEQLRRLLVADAEAIGARITVTDIVLKCMAVALSETPSVREWIDGNEIVSADTVDIGLAIALDDGLVAPVLRDVDRLSLVELSAARKALIERARAGRLAAADLQGGVSTLSNFGSYGGDFETPILNPPQSTMLGIGRIADDVIACDGVTMVRPTMWLSMTYDHRLIDGALAGRFRARLKALLEQPQRLLSVMR